MMTVTNKNNNNKTAVPTKVNEEVTSCLRMRCNIKIHTEKLIYLRWFQMLGPPTVLR